MRAALGFLFAIALGISAELGASPPRLSPPNYDEAKVPQYELPDPLVSPTGERIESDVAWQKRRRGLLEQFAHEMFGHSPPRLSGMTFAVKEVAATYDGLAIKKTVAIKLSGAPNSPVMTLVTYLPAKRLAPAPVFLGVLLFKREDAVPDPGPALFPPGKEPASIPKEDLPGRKTMEVILKRGYGVASIDPADFAPDDAKTYDQGIIKATRVAGSPRGENEWGAIAAWAWGLSRALDYLETDVDVDAKRVIAIGHSRRGKTALWAGAQDERFAMVISNNSGCCGAALSRRQYGETVGLINSRFPHWFCLAFRKYNDREGELPFDQHELVALSAPRPVYVASAVDDRWADPKGEYLAAVAANPVYRLFGHKGLEGDWPPPLNQTVGARIGYHLRVGRHALADFDWMRYLDFADRWLSRKTQNATQTKESRNP